MKINYGVMPNVQLYVIAPAIYDAPKDGPPHYGYGYTEMGVKFCFFQKTKHIPMVAIFPLLEVPSGSARDVTHRPLTHTGEGKRFHATPTVS